jgi:hypothetical protein
LVYPARRALSHAAQAFLQVVNPRKEGWLSVGC